MTHIDYTHRSKTQYKKGCHFLWCLISFVG
jgi:hypothetical protein